MKTTRNGWRRRLSRLAAFTVLGTLLVSGGYERRANANDLLLNFDAAPFPTNAGPNNFFAAGPMQTYSVPDQFTISGGVILGNPTFLPAFANSGSPPNLYATADFADPTLLPDILLTLNTNMDATVVQGLLFNGQTISETYTVSAYDASSNLLYSQIYVVPPDLTTNGYVTFNVFSEAGPPIATVDITTPNSGMNGWDFGVDSIDVTVVSVPEPSALAVTVIGLGLLVLNARRNRRKSTHGRRIPSGNLTAALFLIGSLAACSGLAGPAWVEQGPGPINGGQSEGIGYGGVTNPVAGAINAIVSNPNDVSTIYVGTVNGGVWVTHNPSAPGPTWTPLTDTQLPALSIASLAMDPTDPNTLFAGTGSTSSFGRDGSPGFGIARTTDAGNNWTVVASNTFAGLVVNGVLPAGKGIVIASTLTSGIFRSTDNGNNFAIAQGFASGVSSLVADPGNTNRFYAASPGNGVYRSDDFGSTWNPVNTGLTSLTNRILLAVSRNTGAVFAMVMTNSGASASTYLCGVFRSTNAGASWTGMGAPTPEIFAGGQGYNNGAIVADPDNSNVVFVAGDRQGFGGVFGGVWHQVPNVNGCLDFSANIFRGDASQPAANVWSNAVGSGATGTAPHADSRAMIFYNGVILFAGDGGISRLGGPNNTPPNRYWVDDNGTMRPTEIHSVAYDAVNQVVFAGAQDVGTPMQPGFNNQTWNEQLLGDGGKVAVDNLSIPGSSIRYSGNYYLSGLIRTTWNNNNCVATNTVQLLITNGPSAGTNLNTLDGNSKPGGGDDGTAPMVSGVQFYNPYALNIINPSRMLIATSNSVYESFDRGDSLQDLNINALDPYPGYYVGTGPFLRGAGSSPIAYGSRSNGVPMPDAFYVGELNHLIHRANGVYTFPRLPTNGPTICVARSVVMDPQNYRNVYVLDYFQRVFGSFDEGNTWVELTANLTNLCSDIRCIELFSPTNSPINTVLIAGGLGGVFEMPRPAAGGTIWTNLSTGLPHALFLDLHYDYSNNVLVAGSLGRGAWTLTQFFRGGGGTALGPHLVMAVQQPASSVPSAAGQPGVKSSLPGAVLSWPASDTGYILEANSNLANSGGWVPVPATVTVSNGLYNATVPFTDPQQYFRLSSQ